MIAVISRRIYQVSSLFVLLIYILITPTNKIYAQDLSVTTTISPTLNSPQTAGTSLEYTTVIIYNNPSPSTINAEFSIEPTALTIGNVAIVPTGGTMTAQRPGTTVWDISNMNNGVSIIFNYMGTITSTSSSAINLCAITSTFTDINTTNNIAAIQTFIKPILTQPTNIAICSDESVNKLLSSDNRLTAYSWVAAPSTNTISGQTSSSGSRVQDIITNNGSNSGTITYTVTPSIASPLVLTNGDISTTIVTTLGITKTFTVMAQPVGIINSVSMTGGGSIYYGTTAVFTPNSKLVSSVYNWYSDANKAGGPISSNNGVLTLPFLPIGVHTYYVTVAASGIPFCEGALFPTKVTVIQRPIHPANLFTPNDDHENDKWTITNIDQFPYCTVLVVDQWGENVYFASSGYTNAWDGTFENKPLPSSTYYYTIDLKDGSEPFGGSVTILRK